MANDESRTSEVVSEENGFALLEQAGAGKTLTVRDDQMDYPWLLDAARLCRKKGGRFRLVDSGSLESARMEWLAEAGADIYTSDEVGRKDAEVQSIALAGRRGGVVVAGYVHGPITAPGEQDRDGLLPLANLILSGLRVHVSSGDLKDGHDIPLLISLAGSHLSAGSRLVTYHRGPLSEELVRLGESGTWIHMTDKSLEGLENTVLLRDVVKSAQKTGANGIFHIEKTVDEALFRELQSMGAVLIFRSPHFDFRSPCRKYEDRATDLNLDHRAYYLYPAFFP